MGPVSHAISLSYLSPSLSLSKLSQRHSSPAANKTRHIDLESGDARQWLVLGLRIVDRRLRRAGHAGRKRPVVTSRLTSVQDCVSHPRPREPCERVFLAPCLPCSLASLPRRIQKLNPHPHPPELELGGRRTLRSNLASLGRHQIHHQHQHPLHQQRKNRQSSKWNTQVPTPLPPTPSTRC